MAEYDANIAVHSKLLHMTEEAGDRTARDEGWEFTLRGLDSRCFQL